MSADTQILNQVDKEMEAKILDQLSSSDHSLVRQAVFEAANLNVRSALPKLVELFNSSSVGVQEACEFAVRKLRGQKAIDLIIPSLRSEDVTVRNIAMDILREISTDHIESVIALIYDEDSDLRIFSSDILGSSNSPLALLPLCNALLDDVEANVRYQAAISLGALGNAEAADSLKQALNDEEWVQYAVIEALAKLRDNNSVDILIGALDNVTPLVSSMIVDALGDIKNVKAAPHLLNYIESSNGPMKVKVLKAIIQILGPNVLNLLGAKQFAKLQEYMLSTLLTNQESETYKLILEGLTYVGVLPEATSTILEFITKLELSSSQDLLQDSINCLIKIGYNEKLEEALYSDNEIVRKVAIEACGLLPGKAGRFAIKRHFVHLTLEDKARSLELISNASDIHDIPFFVSLLTEGQDAQILKTVLYFLGAQQYLDAAPTILEYLTYPDEEVREMALQACLALEDEQTVMSIVALLDSEEPYLRRTAVYAMGQVNAEYFYNEIVSTLDDSDENVRKTAIEALGFGIESWEVKSPILIQAMQDKSREVRFSAIEILGEYINEETIPIFVNGLSDSDDWVKIRALTALSQNHIVETTDLIVEMMNSCSLLVQLEAINALALIGGDKAFQTLLTYVSHENPQLQQAAQVAMENITQGGCNE